MKACKFRIVLAIAFVVTSFTACAKSGCDAVERGFNKAYKSALEANIAKQLHVTRVDVLRSFRTDGWSIIYVDTHQSDEIFLFFSRDPLTGDYVTSWSGAATTYEEQDVKNWVLRNAPGIPPNLAKCFAWHVTNHRDL